MSVVMRLVPIAPCPAEFRGSGDTPGDLCDNQLCKCDAHLHTCGGVCARVSGTQFRVMIGQISLSPWCVWVGFAHPRKDSLQISCRCTLAPTEGCVVESCLCCMLVSLALCVTTQWAQVDFPSHPKCPVDLFAAMIQAQPKKSRSSGSKVPGAAVMVGTCSLVLFGFSVQDVLQSNALTSLPRNLDVLELWSGQATVCNAARNRGLAAEPFDKIRIPGKTDRPGRECEDILHKDGFMKALKLVMRLKPRGLLWQGTQCSSFVFADSSNCKRKRGNVEGDLSYQPVVDGNAMANTAAFFMVLCVMRGVQVVLENPAGSQLFEYIRPTTDLIKGLRTQICHRCAYDDNPYPRIGPKAYKFLGTSPWIQQVNQKCSCPVPPAGKLRHQKIMERNAAGGLCGTSVMGASAAYPKLLGEAIVEAWITWRAFQESSKSATGVLESSKSASSKSATGVLESSGSDSDSNSSSAAWEDSPKQAQARKRKQARPPKRKCQRRPRSSSSSCAWSESLE